MALTFCCCGYYWWWAVIGLHTLAAARPWAAAAFPWLCAKSLEFVITGVTIGCKYKIKIMLLLLLNPNDFYQVENDYGTRYSTITWQRQAQW